MRNFLLIPLILFSFLSNGQNWTTSTFPGNANIMDISFSPDSTGWAVSFVPPGIYKSTDYGQTWRWNKTLPVTLTKAIHFISDSIGFIGALNGNLPIIYKTIDKGLTWTQSSISGGFGSSINSIQFINTTDGYAFGNWGSLFLTTNGGSNWTVQPSNLFSNHIWTGFVFGAHDLLLASDNLYRRTPTANWSTPYLGQTSDIDFVSNIVGYAITDSSFIKTTNRGVSWTVISNNPLPNTSVKSLVAIDTNEIYIAGNQNRIYKSLNGGLTWNLELPINNSQRIIALTKFGPDVWAAGSNGQIFKKQRTTVGVDENTLKPAEFNIYPNPFIKNIRIEGSSNQEKQISIFSQTGSLLKTIKTKSSLFNLSDLKDGIYFIRIESGNHSVTKKLIKITP